MPKVDQSLLVQKSECFGKHVKSTHNRVDEKRNGVMIGQVWCPWVPPREEMEGLSLDGRNSVTFDHLNQLSEPIVQQIHDSPKSAVLKRQNDVFLPLLSNMFVVGTKGTLI
ncbi:hypothetical protein SUGI_0774370 [Cryptomeria japonica]|nr:hypothetical protein SUGI_0774370 [Cryptomeria japonica]